MKFDFHGSIRESIYRHKPKFLELLDFFSLPETSGKFQVNPEISRSNLKFVRLNGPFMGFKSKSIMGWIWPYLLLFLSGLTSNLLIQRCVDTLRSTKWGPC